MTYALAGTVNAIRTLADGTIRLVVDLVDNDLGKVAKLAPQYQSVAVAPITAEAKDREEPYSHEYARKLHARGFFRAPEVWRAVGSDNQFLNYIRRQEKSATGRPGTEDDPIEAAHVRRVANGAGTGIKPDYSAIPLCHSEHALQHQKGETAIASQSWWDQQRLKYCAEWAKWQLKKNYGVDHLYEISPDDLHTWATEKDIQRFLPALD